MIADAMTPPIRHLAIFETPPPSIFHCRRRSSRHYAHPRRDAIHLHATPDAAAIFQRIYAAAQATRHPFRFTACQTIV